MSALRRALDIAARAVNRKPTEAQKESGNYAKGHVRMHGLNIAIENPKGGTRSGTDKGGKAWKVTMPAHYGYVKGTEGKDGDHVDVYIGPHETSGKVYVVDQVDAKSGAFDEHKALLGFRHKDQALTAYRKAFSDGKADNRIGGVTEMSIEAFKSWLKSGKTKKPLTGLRGGAEMDSRRGYKNGGAVTFRTQSVTVSPGADLDEILGGMRGYAEGGLVDPFGGDPVVVRQGPGDASTEDLMMDLRRRALADRPLGLPAPLGGQLRDAQLGEGAFEDDGRRRDMPALLDMILGGGEFAVEMTGVPSVVRGVRNLREGYDTGDILQGAAGAGQMALGALPGAFALRGGSRALASVLESPWRAGAVGGSLGVPQALLETREARAASASDVKSKLRGMSPAEIKAYQELIGATPDGVVGPNTIQKGIAYETKRENERALAEARAAAEAQARNAVELKRVEGQNAAGIEAARVRAEIEAQAAAKAVAEEKAREKQAKLPFRELYPEIMPWMPVAAGALAGVTGGAIKGSYVKKFNRQLDDLVPKWEAAVAGRDPAMARALGEQVGKLRARGPGGTAPALGAGGFEGAQGAILPEEIDLWRGVPGAWERMTDIPAISKRAGIGVLTGMGAASLGLSKSAASGRKSEDVRDFSPETEVMLGVKKGDINTANNLAAYEEAVQAARTASSNARARADRDISVADAKSRSGSAQARQDALAAERSALDSELEFLEAQSLRSEAAAEARRRLSGPGGGLGSGAGAQSPSQSPRGGSGQSPSGASSNDAITSSSPKSPAGQGRALPAPAGGGGKYQPYLPGGTSGAKANDVLMRALKDELKLPGEINSPESRKLITETLIEDLGKLRGKPVDVSKIPAMVDKTTDELMRLFKAADKADIEKPGFIENLLREARKKRGTLGYVPTLMGGAALMSDDEERADGGRVFLKTKDKAGRWQLRNENGKYASGGAVEATRKGYATGGKVHVGPVVGKTGGRADKLPVSVPEGAFVIPADIVSALGEGNSLAGMEVLKSAFGKALRSAGGGSRSAAVPIKISDGEYVISPDQVEAIGRGDRDHGHQILDQMVLRLRKQHIDTLAKLPGPAK